MKISNTENTVPARGREVIPTPNASGIYSDGTYVEILKDQILCHLTEQNGFSFKDGLEMEVYIYEESIDEPLRSLKFLPTSRTIENNILIDETATAEVSLDPSYVEYYLNLKTDAFIPNKDLCKGIQNLKSQNIELNFDVDCEDDESIFF